MANSFILNQVVTDSVLEKIDRDWHKHETTPLAQMFRGKFDGREFYTLSRDTAVAAVIMVKCYGAQREVLDYFGPNFGAPEQDALEEIGRIAVANAWMVPINSNTRVLHKTMNCGAQATP